MEITGELLIGGKAKRGISGAFYAQNAASGEKLQPAFGGATKNDLEEATFLAWAAFPLYRETGLEARASFLEEIGKNILALGDKLVLRAMAETGLPQGRIEGERKRTVMQLNMFAEEVRSGKFLELRYDAGDPQRKPVPKPDLRLRNVALGPVAVFGASNFPLAFSVAGGDTASALAAGCPVVVKAHSAHPGTSELVGRAVQKAVATCGLPEGTFALLFDTGREVSQALIADPHIRAVGFTGSRSAGTTFMHIAANRPQPIPVYAEMSSINPVILFPQALATQGSEIGRKFVDSLTLGAGQFCTNPGLILAVNGIGLDDFIAAAAENLQQAAPQTMLTAGICLAYQHGTAKLATHPKVTTLATGLTAGDHQAAAAALFETSGQDFIEHTELHEEVFGAASLVVRCKDEVQLRGVLSKLEGQLTIALHIADGDHDAAAALLPDLENLAGRLLVNGFGTGVEVSPAMVHGGPYPSTSDGRSTSVGTLAIHRFLRPVCYQDFPLEMLADVLR